MSTRKELSLFQHGEIIGAWKCGGSIRKIAEKLNHTITTVQKVISTYRDHGYEKPPPRTGKIKKITDRDDRALRKIIKGNRKINIHEIKESFIESTSKEISENTLRRHLHEIGFYGRVGVRKPFISEANRKKRLNWAKERQLWKDEWDGVIWSDESKFELFRGDGRRWVWRQPHEKYDVDCLIPTVKSGQESLMIWGCFTKNGVGPLVRLNGRITSKEYIDVLNGHLIPYINNLENKENVIFQEDNAPIHTARIVKDWKRENDITNLPWPAQNPDLNPIENLWGILERKIQTHKPLPKNKEELWQILQEDWLKIDNHTIQNLIDSMPHRVAAVIENIGNPTKY